MTTPATNQPTSTPTSPTPESSSSDPTAGQGSAHRDVGNASPAEAQDAAAEAFVLEAFGASNDVQEGAAPIPPGQTSPADPAPAAPSTQTSPQEQSTVQQTPPANPQQPVTPTTPVQPAQQPATPVQPTPPQQAQPQAPVPAQAVSDPQDGLRALADAVEQGRSKFVDALATTAYRLSAEDADALVADPAVAVPKMLANAHVNIVQNVLRTIGAQMPHLVGGLLEARQRNAEYENAFFTKWPQLDRQKDEPVVRQLAAAYRMANPAASSDELIQMVGAQAVVALGRIQAQVPVAPAAPSPRQQGFRPAAANSPPAQVQQTPTNPFEAMAEAMLSEDRGGFYVE